MPHLWKRIESRQNYSFSFRRMANALATAAMALSIALGVYLAIPHSNPTQYSQGYVEALAEATSLDTPDIVGAVHLDASDFGK